MEIAEVINVGLEVFDTSKQFEIWLKAPSITLGFKAQNITKRFLRKRTYYGRVESN